MSHSKKFPPITQTQIGLYATASGDHNPIHLNPDFAKSAGLGGTIAHGMLSMGMVGRSLLERGFAIENLKKFDAKFKGIVPAGESVEVFWESHPQDPKQLLFSLKDSHGQDVVTGTITLK